MFAFCSSWLLFLFCFGGFCWREGGGGVLTEDPELRQEVQESMNVLSALQGSTRDNLI